jgi:hypothetical protein
VEAWMEEEMEVAAGVVAEGGGGWRRRWWRGWRRWGEWTWGRNHGGGGRMQ